MNCYEAAEQAGVHLNTIYSWVRRGYISAHKPRLKSYSIDPMSLEDFLKTKKHRANYGVSDICSSLNNLSIKELIKIELAVSTELDSRHFEGE